MASDRSSGDPIADCGKTQRIVFFLDLNPLLSFKTQLHFSKPSSPPSKPSSLPSSLRLFLRLQILLLLPLSTALLLQAPHFSLPLFPPPRPHFQFPLPNPQFPPRISPRPGIAASLRQLLHDCAWDPVICDRMTGMFSNSDSVVVRSNLVVLFSPVCVSANCLTEFLNVGVGDESLKNVNAFSERFRGFFENVNDAFLSRDIHCSWVDVRYELECGEGKVGNDEDKTRFGFFKSGVRSLGWGFGSTGLIILGSALVPFGLIYPEIGISSKFFGCDDSHKKVNAQLSLKILDVSGKPLECKFCDLQLVDLKMLPRNPKFTNKRW